MELTDKKAKQMAGSAIYELEGSTYYAESDDGGDTWAIYRESDDEDELIKSGIVGIMEMRENLRELQARE